MRERVAVIATERIVTVDEFGNISLPKMKLDTPSVCRHTQTTVTSTTRISALRLMSAQLSAVVFAIVTVILILPR